MSAQHDKAARFALPSILAILWVALIYVVFKMIGFTVWPFESFWGAIPAFSLAVFLSVVNWERKEPPRDLLIHYSRNRSNWKIGAIFLAAFILWAIARSTGELFSQPTEYVPAMITCFNPYDQPPCPENSPIVATQAVGTLIDKIAASVFAFAPFALLHSRFRAWIVGQ